MNVETLRFILCALLMLLGLVFEISAVIGVFRFRYVLNRMHGASMGDSLGLFLVVAALCISAPDGWVVVKLLLVSLFVWITSPTGGHLIARLELVSNEHPENEMEVIEK